MAISRLCLIACVTALVFPVAGCGSDDDDEGSSSDSGATSATTEQTAEPELDMTVGSKPLSFDKKSYTAEAGDIVIRFSADTRIGHNVRVQTAKKPCCLKYDIGGTDTVSDGQETTATVNLKPGKYTLYCSLGGHWQGGMKANLVVN